MNYDWAVPGVKCVCINAAKTHWRNKAELIQGATYTIRSVGVSEGVVCVSLREVRRSFLWFDVAGICPFFIGRFRPLVTRTEEQDIATFREIARQAQTPVGAEKVTT